MVRRPRNILLKAEVNEASTATENVKHVDDKKRKDGKHEATSGSTRFRLYGRK